MSSRALTAPKLCRSPSARSIDRGRELAQFVGFDQIAAVPQVEHVHQWLHAHIGGRDDDRQRGLRLPNALQQGNAVGIGQPHVEDQDVGLEGTQLAHGFRAVRRVGHGVFAFKKPLVRVLEGGFVFDEEDFARRRRHRANLRQETPVSNSNRSSSLVRTSRKRSSSLAPRRHTVWRRSAALRWISINAPRPALSTERVPDRSITRRPAPRSEEHTSELQSLAYLVCRLLLEKKKLYPYTTLFRSRSEEHTSELQSLAYLVCRLLLEKKKVNSHW